MRGRVLNSEEALISKVLDKVELAVRRAQSESHNPSAYLLGIVANELAKINRELGTPV
jgi:hypothetical protein